MTPTEEEILAHRVIVATLNTSRIIASLKLEKGKERGKGKEQNYMTRVRETLVGKIINFLK